MHLKKIKDMLKVLKCDIEANLVNRININIHIFSNSRCSLTNKEAQLKVMKYIKDTDRTIHYILKYGVLQ